MLSFVLTLKTTFSFQYNLYEKIKDKTTFRDTINNRSKQTFESQITFTNNNDASNPKTNSNLLLPTNK